MSIILKGFRQDIILKGFGISGPIVADVIITPTIATIGFLNNQSLSAEFYYSGGDIFALRSGRSPINLTSPPIGNYSGGQSAGAVYNSVVTVTAATYSPIATDYSIYCNTSSNNITVTLPAASSSIGRRLEILNTNSNTVIIQVSGGGYINTQTTQTLYTGDTLTLESDGGQWWIK